MLLRTRKYVSIEHILEFKPHQYYLKFLQQMYIKCKIQERVYTLTSTLLVNTCAHDIPPRLGTH